MQRVENVHVLVRNADRHHQAAVGSVGEGELEEGAAAGFSVSEITCGRFTLGGDDEIEVGISGPSRPMHGSSEEVVELRKAQWLLDAGQRARGWNPPVGSTGCCHIARLNPYLGTGCNPNLVASPRPRPTSVVLGDLARADVDAEHRGVTVAGYERGSSGWVEGQTADADAA